MGTKIDLSGEFIHQFSPLPLSCQDSSIPGSAVQEFFRDAHVFITGATGFMGKVLVEKLLVSCPKIKKIHILVREKRGKSSDERLYDLLNDNMFLRVKKLVPNFKDKVSVIHGDCREPNLGVCASDYQQLTAITNIIFHGAATVKFNEKLSDAALINVAGIQEIILFSRQCKKLKSVVHISTAYTNTLVGQNIVEEKLYPPWRSYRDILALARKDPEKLNTMEDSIISPWPNTYTFTKKLGEDVVMQEGVGIPISVFRPGIVVGSHKEPTPGWLDNIYGPIAIMVGNFTGHLRVLRGSPESLANIVPVDMAVNALIAAAWKNCNKLSKSSDEISVYNFTSMPRNPVPWVTLFRWNTVHCRTWPYIKASWYPVAIIFSQKWIFRSVFFCMNTIPAYFFDFGLRIYGQKPMLVLMSQKILQLFKVLSYFYYNFWEFKEENVIQLWEELSAEDKTIYPFDIRKIDWNDHTRTQLLGIRVHVMKDPITTLEAARSRLRKLKIYHRLLQFIFFLLFNWLFWKSRYRFLALLLHTIKLKGLIFSRKVVAK